MVRSTRGVPLETSPTQICRLHVNGDPRSCGVTPYTTLHPGSPRAGAGLGLVIVRIAAARHGGRAWARSAPGGCTEFFMSFPA